MFDCQLEGCSTGAILLVTKNFSRVRSNVYRVVRVSYTFLACHIELAKYQTCLLFQ